MNNDLSAKLTALRVEIVPGLSRLGVVLNSKDPGLRHPIARSSTSHSRPALAVALTADASTVPEFERAFARLGEEGVQGVIFLADSRRSSSMRVPLRRLRSRNSSRCRLRFSVGKMSKRVASCRTGDGWTTSSAKRPCMSIAFLREPSRLTCRRNNQRDSQSVINSKTANALGLKISDRLIAPREVIE